MPSTATAARSAEVRQRIVEAAGEVFAEAGFAGAGVDEIARRAGVNKAMLYYHVGNKAALFSEVVSSFIGPIKAELVGAIEARPRARLLALALAFARVAREKPHFPRIMLREVAMGGAHLPAELLQEIRGVMSFTRRAVEDGREDGDFRAVDPLVVHLMLIGSMLFIANAVRLRDRMETLGTAPPDSPKDLIDAARMVVDIVLNGIAAGRPQGERS